MSVVAGSPRDADLPVATAGSTSAFEVVNQMVCLNMEYVYPKMFDLHRPSDLMSGLWKGGKVAVDGFTSGLYALIALPMTEENAFYIGVAKGLLSLMTLPIVGVGVAAVQTGRGAVNTAEAVIESSNGKDYNMETGMWYEYRLDEDEANLAAIELPRFKRPAGIGRGSEKLLEDALDGLELFVPFIGVPDFEAAIAWMKSQASRHAPAGIAAEEQVAPPVLGQSPTQRKRHVHVARQLIERIALYTAGDIEEFAKTVHEEARRLAGVPFGADLLYVVAEIYSVCASEFAGGLSGAYSTVNLYRIQMLNRASFTGAVIGGVSTLLGSLASLSVGDETKSRALDAEALSSLKRQRQAAQERLARAGVNAAFAWLVLDIEHALIAAVAKVLRDHSVDGPTRTARAEGIAKLGAIFMERAVAAGGSKDPKPHFDELAAKVRDQS